ncbi:MAG TPA: hypothetical protein IAA32_06930 [Candidatus Butyricicoccus stercorigallinarum]|nr:hypothetical protein [Candidatus Butyricicoccus stercorigallinarum]
MVTPESVWREYQRGVDYNNRIDLYDRVRTNENFFVGRQWEGLNVTTLDPLIFNVLRRVVNLFISMLVSDDIAVTAQPYQDAPDAETVQKVLDRAVASVIERTGVKSKNRYLLRNACVDGDGCFYIRFDPDRDSGQGVQGDIEVDLIENTDVFFGNPAVDDVQRQPYLILSMRRSLASVRREAVRRGMSRSEAETIQPDSLLEPQYDPQTEDADDMVTVLLRMQRTPDGIAFFKCTRNAVLMPETVAPYRRYPVAYMSWERVKHCYHGASPVTEAIPNQIAINKLYSMYVQCIKHVAFPKIIYDMTRFPNGYSSDIGKAVGMRGNPNEAILSAFRAPEISTQVMALLSQMMKDTMELMGASDATLGNVKPDNTSAIVTVQQATIAPLELVRMEFYRFVEDTVRIFVDLMRVHYGRRKVFLVDDSGAEKTVRFDFGALDAAALELNVEVGSSAYWSETMQTTTNDNLLERGIITDPVLYVENIPDSQIRGKSRLLRALREQRENGQPQAAPDTTAAAQAAR